MDHNLAAETQAVERYLLGEMDPKERDSFEEHYFTCPECAKDVRAAARFRANAREVLREPQPFERPEKERRSSWWSWPSLVPMAASLAFSGVVWYQSNQLPVIIGAVGQFEVHETTRGGGNADNPEKLVRIPKGKGLVTLDFVIPADAPPALYDCKIADSAGKVAGTTIVDGKPGSKGNIWLNREHLAPGLYTLTLTLRIGERPIDQYTFQME